ncbi:MAG: undecaprenyl-diphosphate phosphatase [Candidatus Andersenbacteria bacterium]
MWIGIAQGIALPTRRLALRMAIATGKLHGLSREAAARFSFVLAGPIIAGAVGKTLLDLKNAPPGTVEWGPLALGVVVAGVVGFAAIRWLLRFLKTHSLVPFAVYMIVLGAVLLTLGALGWA